MKKVLIAGGDSFTDKNYISDFHSDMDCSWKKWPEILAERLNMNCVNTGFCGSGNMGIYSRVIDTIGQHDPNEIGYVLVGWSQAQREDWEMSRIDPRNTAQLHKWTNNTIGEVVEPFYFLRRNIRLYYSLQQVCSSLGIKYKQFQMLHPISRATGLKGLSKIDRTRKRVYDFSKEYSWPDLYKAYIEAPLFENIDEDHFIDWPIFEQLGGNGCIDVVLLGDENTTYRISEHDNHPNAEGHQLIADYIYENL